MEAQPMFFVLVGLPILGGVLAGVAKGAKTVRAGKDIKKHKTAVLPPRMVTEKEYKESLETQDPERLRELDRVGTYRYAVYQAHVQQEAA